MILTEQAEYLIYLVEKGMHQRYAGHDLTDIKKRLEYELNVVITKGFSEYFLILADMMQFCRDQDIAVGPGRGSAGGSAVAYTTYITDVEPIRHGLIFDRFLNSERKALPDIDVDICWANRQRVIDYIVGKYGEDKVAQIVTFNTLKPKALLQDVGRVLQIPLKEVEALKALISDHDVDGLDDLRDNTAFMSKLNAIAEREPRLIPAMTRLEGLHRNASLHAGGIIIARDPIISFMPTYRKGGKGRAAVQYEMFDAEAVGGLKMDVLGLKTVTMIDWAEKDVRAKVDPTFRTRGMAEDDRAAFDIINAGDTAGIFQLEGTGITRFAQDMRIDSFNDIVALLALYRPGPLDTGMAYDYIKRKNGQQEVDYPHPDLEPVLRDTYGIITYQEQVMFVLGIMAGYSMGKADTMRKAMGKKDDELMAEELGKFREAAAATGRYDQETIQKVSDLIETFARYGFNKSHAVEYAYLTYWSAVIKARYPAAFYAAWLNVTEESAKRGHIIDMAERKGIKVLPPDVNISGPMFTMDDPGTLRFGLAAVSGMGDTFVEKLMKSREATGPFAGFHDFCQRLTSIPIDKKEALAASGAFDFYQRTEPLCTRAFLLEHGRAINELAKKKGEFTYDRFRPVPEFEPLKMAELEKQYLSFYVTTNPIRLVQDELRMAGAEVGVPTEELVGAPLLGGRVVKCKPHQTGKGKPMAFIVVDDGLVQHDITIFPELWARWASTLAEDNMVVIRCDVGMYKGKKSLSAVHVEPLDLTQRKMNLVVNMGTQIGPLFIAQLRYLLDNAKPGRSSVDIWATHDGKMFRMRSGRYQIDVTDDLIAGARGLFGPLAVSLRPEV